MKNSKKNRNRNKNNNINHNLKHIINNDKLTTIIWKNNLIVKMINYLIQMFLFKNIKILYNKYQT